MRHRLPPVGREPELGDLCRLAGPGDMPTQFFRKHGLGMVIDKSIHPQGRVTNYEIRWLKTDERMRFFAEDLIVVSAVD
jgi:hypothetical protein